MSTNPIERTVQLTGTTTYTVSLPKGWATSRGIEPGTNVQLYPGETGVFVAPSPLETDPPADPSPTPSQREIDANAADLDHALAAAYTEGVDRIVYQSESLSAADRRRIVEIVDEYIGLEVVTETDETVVVGTMLDSSGLSTTVDRLRTVAVSAHRDAVAAVVDDDPELAALVTEDRRVDRLAGLLDREFYTSVREANRSIARTLGLYATGRELVHVGNEADRIARIGSVVPPAFSESVRAHATAIQDAVDAAVDRQLGAEQAGRQVDTDELRRALDEFEAELDDAHGAVRSVVSALDGTLSSVATIGQHSRSHRE